MTIDWQPLRKIIDEHQRFLLSSHVRPDADALGSELGLAGILEHFGKTVQIVNPSATPRHLDFLDPKHFVKKIGQDFSEEKVLDTDVHIVLDTSSWAQLVDVGDALKRTQAVKVVIDHHVSSDDVATNKFCDSSAEATGALIYRLAKFLDVPITEKIAHPLFCAIATDTGWFRFSSTTGETLRIVGALIDAGVKPHEIYRQLYEQYTQARLKLSGRIFERITLDCEGRLAYLWVSTKDFKETKAVPADTEDLINECLTIAGTECAFIAIEQYSKMVKVSFRSRSNFNVAAIAESFGGGGHRQAAGATLPGPLSKVRENVLAAMKAALNG